MSQSDINEIRVSGRIFGKVDRNERGEAVYYECVVKSVYVVPNRGTTIESYHNVSAHFKTEAGRKLSQAHDGEKVMVTGRMTSYRGLKKDGSGEHYISFFKINPTSIDFVEQMERETNAAANDWNPPSSPLEPTGGLDDIPF